MQDEIFMEMAIQEAKLAALEEEVPVGAVIVQNGEVISTGRNKREFGENALYHAEIEAIDKACKKLKSWRLLNCEMFVTLEPCPMCAGAIINSRIKRLVFGASDYKAGACGSVVNLFDFPFNHKPELVSGVLADDCGELLSEFFKALRKNKKIFKS